MSPKTKKGVALLTSSGGYSVLLSKFIFIFLQLSLWSCGNSILKPCQFIVTVQVSSLKMWRVRYGCKVEKTVKKLNQKIIKKRPHYFPCLFSTTIGYISSLCCLCFWPVRRWWWRLDSWMTFGVFRAAWRWAQGWHESWTEVPYYWCQCGQDSTPGSDAYCSPLCWMCSMQGFHVSWGSWSHCPLWHCCCPYCPGGRSGRTSDCCCSRSLWGWGG